jgi:hypothetical protein
MQNMNNSMLAPVCALHLREISFGVASKAVKPRATSRHARNAGIALPPPMRDCYRRARHSRQRQPAGMCHSDATRHSGERSLLPFSTALQNH